MVWIFLALLIVGFFFPPAWLGLVGYSIYVYASRKSRRDDAVEGRIKRMLAAGAENHSFKELYFESAKSYAIAKGARSPENDAASATIMLEGRSYFVIFMKDRDGGTSICVRDSHAVEREITLDLERRLGAKQDEPHRLAGLGFGELGKLTAEGDSEAFDVILQGARQGDGEAQLEAGFAYAKGFCVKQDLKLAAHWYEKSAAQGTPNAQFNLGCLHYSGLGCKRSVENALYWFEMAAESGHNVAKQNIAPMRMEAGLVAEEQVYWSSLGVNKAPGLVKYALAQNYLADLKVLAADSEIRTGLEMITADPQASVAKADKVLDALILIYNLSSATPLSMDKICEWAVHNNWSELDTMPKS